jgi:tetratricopeptide (TPR) repeat protein
LEELVNVVDEFERLDKKFLASLLRSLVHKGGTDILKTALPHIEHKVAECVEQAGRIDELVTWRSFYLAVDRRDEANACADAAFAVEPTSLIECDLLLSLYHEVGRERDALPALDRLVHNRLESSWAYPAYLRLAERYGTQSHWQRVIDESSAWLAAHPDNLQVRTIFLRFVERKGTTKEVARMLQETDVWLAVHPDDHCVRRTFLRFVERKGTAKDIARVLQETTAWLAAYPDDDYVRTAFLGLVERKGTAKDIARVLREPRAWLTMHPDGFRARTHFLALLERQGTAEEMACVLQEITAWLAAHPDDRRVRRAFLRLVEGKGTAEQCRHLP